MKVRASTIEEEEDSLNMAAICIGDRIRCRDGVEGTVTDLHKYSKDYHIVIKTDKGEERELNLSEYCKN